MLALLFKVLLFMPRSMRGGSAALSLRIRGRTIVVRGKATSVRRGLRVLDDSLGNYGYLAPHEDVRGIDGALGVQLLGVRRGTVRCFHLGRVGLLQGMSRRMAVYRAVGFSALLYHVKCRICNLQGVVV